MVFIVAVAWPKVWSGGQRIRRRGVGGGSLRGNRTRDNRCDDTSHINTGGEGWGGLGVGGGGGGCYKGAH